MLHTFIPEGFRMFPETSGKLFGNFSVPRQTCHNGTYKEFTCQKNTNFTTVNTCFIPTNPGKFPVGNFLRRKIPRENISDNFVKFRKFFLTGGHFGKFRRKHHTILSIKSIIYRLYISVYIILSRSCHACFRKLPGNFSETFLSHD